MLFKYWKNWIVGVGCALVLSGGIIAHAAGLFSSSKYKILEPTIDIVQEAYQNGITDEDEIKLFAQAKKINKKVELPRRRTDRTQTFVNPNGSFSQTSQLGLVFPRYVDDYGIWHDIDTTIVESSDPDYAFMNISNRFKTFFSSNPFNNSKTVKLQFQDAWIKFDTIKELQVKSSDQSTLQILKRQDLEQKNISMRNKNKAIKTRSKNTIRYPQVFNNNQTSIDADYTVSSSKLLEELVLSRYQTIPQVTQELELLNAYPVMNGKKIDFYHTTTNKLLWSIPEPVMYEKNNPQISNTDIHYQISCTTPKIPLKKCSTFTLTKIIEAKGDQWMSDIQRIYPVIIDATVGPNSPTTASDDATVGTQAWSTPGDAVSSNNQYAAIINPGSEVQSHYLKATNFGFSLASSDSISGITVEFERFGLQNTGAIYCVDINTKLIKSGTIQGNNNASSTHWSTSEAYYTYGSSSDLWGLTWTPGNVTSTNFGVVLNITSTYSVIAETGANCYVDHIRTTITYTSAPSTPTSLAEKASSCTGTTLTTSSPWTNQTTICFLGTSTDADSNTVKLCAEATSTGTNFGNSGTCGALVTSGTVATVTLSSLAQGTYHWQAYAQDSTGASSSWVSFPSTGTNPEASTDFGIDTANPTTTISSPTDLSWTTTTISFAISDTDGLSGTSSCGYTVKNLGGSTTSASRTCGATFTVATSTCSNETASSTCAASTYKCDFTATSTDKAANTTSGTNLRICVDYHVPTCTASSITVSSSTYMYITSASTVYMNAPSCVGCVVTSTVASTDSESTVQKVNFPAITSYTGASVNDTVSPYASSYTLLSTSTTATPLMTCTDVAQNTATVSFNFNVDTTSPAWTASTTDNGSAGTLPTTTGGIITFNATGTDAGIGVNKLLVCKTNSVASNATCTVANWCISATGTSATGRSCTYTTTGNEGTTDATYCGSTGEACSWYGFLCDGVANCSASASVTGTGASPFFINHVPNFTGITDSPDPASIGSLISFTATASDTDSTTTDSHVADTVNLFVCKTQSLTSCSAGCASTWATSTGASNPVATYTVLYTDTPGTKNYYSYVCDSHNIAATSTSQGATSTFVINPGFSFSVSTTTVDFGSLSSSAIKWATAGAGSNGTTTEPANGLPLQITITTNAPSGLAITLRGKGNGSGVSGDGSAGLYSSTLSSLIAATSSANVATGTPSYGVYIKNASGLSIANSWSGATATGTISTTDQTVATSSAAVSGATIDVTLRASISGTTAAGTYSDTLYIIGTATF